MKVSYIFRKQHASYFSIEKVFAQVTATLERKLEMSNTFVPHIGFSPVKVVKNLLAVRKIKADLFHITGDVHYVAMGLAGRKTILTIHDCVFLHAARGGKRWLLKRLFLDWPVKHCRVITTISEKSRTEILQYSGCPPEKVVVVPNPVGARFYYSPKPFNDQLPELLFIGSTSNKNLERVIRALEGLSCRLRIVGKLSEAQRQLLKQGNILYEQKSGLTEQELADAYAQCDVVLFPSLYEGFGLPIIEGQKSGRPVITSNISPMKEVAAEGACLVDPLDIQSIRAGVEKVIRDRAYRESIVQKGLVNVQQYDAAVIADKYLQVYQEVINRQ